MKCIYAVRDTHRSQYRIDGSGTTLNNRGVVVGQRHVSVKTSTWTVYTGKSVSCRYAFIKDMSEVQNEHKQICPDVPTKIQYSNVI